MCVLQGLMYWRPEGDLTLVSSRVSGASRLQRGRFFTLVNSVAVSQTTGKAYFTSSTDIPPLFTRDGLYTPMRSAQLSSLLVRSHSAGVRSSLRCIAHTITLTGIPSELSCHVEVKRLYPC